jgi:hypothetical protein
MTEHSLALVTRPDHIRHPGERLATRLRRVACPCGSFAPLAAPDSPSLLTPHTTLSEEAAPVTFKVNDLMVDVLSTDMKGGDKGCGPCTKCTKCTTKTGPVSGCTDTAAVGDCCGTKKAEHIGLSEIELLRAQMRAMLDARAA